MGPLGHRRQVLLFLGAILVPCVVLVALSVRMAGQERELAEKRRGDERHRVAEQMAGELSARLERIKIEELGALAAEPGSVPRGSHGDEVALVARMKDRKLVLPWEDGRGQTPAALFAEAEHRSTPELRTAIREADQARAMQGDFPGLGLLHAGQGGAEPAWIPYGDPLWLVSAAESEPGAGVVVAVRAHRVARSLAGIGDVRLSAESDSAGELLGQTFPGVRAVFMLPADTAALKRGQLERNAYYVAVLLVLGATTFGAYLLWSDLGRELRLAELRSQFVASVSHELKTPLTAIRMFAETLQMGRQPNAETQAEYLDTIVNECERLTRLVDNVLQFSRIEQGKKVYQFRPVRLEEVVSAAARAMRYPLEQQGFQLRVSLEDGLPSLRGDADALQQAVLNLLSNAMKYSGESRMIELELRREQDQAVVRVRDHGVGIAPEQQALIFEKFYRVPTPESRLIPGTGLGLTLVAHTAKAHGGRVEVRSAPGQGSTFALYLPLENQS
jgi:signal transduction histidine kinase